LRYQIGLGYPLKEAGTHSPKRVTFLSIYHICWWVPSMNFPPPTQSDQYAVLDACACPHSRCLYRGFLEHAYMQKTTTKLTLLYIVRKHSHARFHWLFKLAAMQVTKVFNGSQAVLWSWMLTLAISSWVCFNLNVHWGTFRLKLSSSTMHDVVLPVRNRLRHGVVVVANFTFPRLSTLTIQYNVQDVGIFVISPRQLICTMKLHTLAHEWKMKYM
jgi:hypothetical protein